MEANLSELFDVLRYVLSDERALVHSIDESYQKLLFERLSLIPKSKSSTINTTAEILKCVFSAIDYGKLSTSLAKYEGLVKIEIDFENICLRYIDNHMSDVEMKVRAYLKSLVSSLKPIFNCLNRIISQPSKFTHKLYVYFNDDESAHIFDGI